MIKFDVITLFPQLFTEHLNNLPFKKAQKKRVAKYKLWNLRDFTTNSYGSVDDKTYGGGVGMILMIEPIFKALEKIYGKKEMGRIIKSRNREKENYKDKKTGKDKRIILLSPRGKTYTQEKARELAKCDQITIICGRYEGVDSRIEESIATDVISIGDYVLSGGEIASLAIMESITRILPDVLEKSEAREIESFSDNDLKSIEYPQYTKPEEFKGLKVPDILLSGNHKEIEKWRKDNSNKSGKEI